ncbi:TMEM43 family protein [Candidatus Halobeggiatoa sp. HSG11]|nr:TMEM43 family protein [Candidatus Halobeggiatoa sp. HSG11]
MSDTEITTESWWSRIKSSFVCVLFGLILFLVAFPFIFWNEGRAVYQAQTLEEGFKIVTPIGIKQVNPKNNGKLVHVIGKVKSSGTLADNRFGLAQDNIIKLKRIVQMYQWKEHTHYETIGYGAGGKRRVKIYTYNEVWSNEIIYSSSFRQWQSHKNPSSMPFNYGIFQAKQVIIGAFTLPPNLINKVNNYQDLPLTTTMLEQVPEEFKHKLQLYNNFYYMGDDPTQPKIGDVRINFKIVSPATISIISKQEGSTFYPYVTEIGGKIELFKYGEVSAENMFQHEQEFNVIVTWLLRLIGFVVMFIGLLMIFKIVKNLAAVLPFLTNIFGFVGNLVALIVAAALSLITIAIAWIFYHPLLGIALLVIAAGFLYILKFICKPQEDIMPITEIVG